ncbi:transcriptional regulator [Ktedonosporobacter rubrisoli]|uniref:Transcriptional regulator n=1 Tax=Ktedonosporobacter rubrisoli TaxID=2509675 RepID=A0A4P6JWB5_KTERU|nr:metalloregulator ArsR/SmtB family transcription factor [Ktedonosporobacter rubrisoli]QBD79672.1 transcriptional regulator [Ktedonosporobacter rubrisoli]
MLTQTRSAPIVLQAKLFRGFSDLSRLSLLSALRTGPLTVSELIEHTGLTQSNTSNHLRCLLDCNLVTCEQQGRYVRYALADPRIAELLALSEELLKEVTHGVSACPRYAAQEEDC